ncbi:hypothetical protein [Methylobacterium crusticola]|nr:hypothetical protein [Methylobacterium crusticola]
MDGRPETAQIWLPTDTLAGEAVAPGSLSVLRLRKIEKILGVSLGHGEGEAVATGEDAPALRLGRQAVDLMRAFAEIADPQVRQNLLVLVQAAAERNDQRN